MYSFEADWSSCRGRGSAWNPSPAMAENTTGAMGEDAPGAVGEDATGAIGNDAPGAMGEDATGALGGGRWAAQDDSPEECPVQLAFDFVLAHTT
ncbi:unnamed protein product, partial [Ascophyllum nodosum]